MFFRRFRLSAGHLQRVLQGFSTVMEHRCSRTLLLHERPLRGRHEDLTFVDEQKRIIQTQIIDSLDEDNCESEEGA